MIRYSFEPVERQLIAQGTLLELLWAASNCADDVGHVAALAGRLRVSRNSIYRWRRNGLTPKRADELAVELGLTPHLLWPEWGRELVAA